MIREGSGTFVVMDTAPTGHTLLLLDATGAYHREVDRQCRLRACGIVTPMMQLQDPDRTRVLIVTLPETTPVLEAAQSAGGSAPGRHRALGLGGQPQPRGRGTRHAPLLRQRARNELREIAAVAGRHAGRYAVVPLLKEEPVGVERLLELVDHSIEEIDMTEKPYNVLLFAPAIRRAASSPKPV